jgi:lysyl-tRNA synthetase class 2
LRAIGCEPYAYSWTRTHTALQLQNLYQGLSNGEEANEAADIVSVAGRIIARRAFGKLTFLTLKDESGSIQVYINNLVALCAKF